MKTPDSERPAPPRKKRPRKWRVMRFRKNDPSHNLLAAATHWIKANHGTAAVIGGIGIMPGELDYNYYLTIGVVGKRPTKDKPHD